MGSIQLLKDAVDLLNLIEANTEGGVGGGGTPSGTPNQVVATDPSGVATSPAALRALVAADIPIVTSAKVSNFDTQVRSSRLDQMAAPNADVSMNTHKITGVVNPASAQDAATKAYVDSVAISPEHAYYADLCLALEPDAIEDLLGGTFSYNVGAGVTKYLMLGWNLYLGANANARYDVRMPGPLLPLRNIALHGSNAASTGAILDPARVSYASPRDLYFDRLLAIRNMDTKFVENHGPANNNYSLFLPGPYGVIVTSSMIFDYAWPALKANQVVGSAWAFENELADSGNFPVRFQHAMHLAITKAMTSSYMTGFPNNANARGVLTYVLLPSDWSQIVDPHAPYLFRDDFMGAALDTATVWSRSQSSAGNVEIDTNFAWVKVVGNNGWGNNGAFSQASIARANGRVFMCDVAAPVGMPYDDMNFVVGFHDGSGLLHSDFAHGIDFTTPNSLVGTLVIFENGTNRGTVGLGWTAGHNYRVRITLGASNNAVYEIQGGPEYHSIGSATWDDITPVTSSSTTTPLHAGFTRFAATPCYVGDIRMY
jgi:hypothetical protein